MTDSQPTVLVMQPDATNFLDSPVDLKKLLRAVSKESAKAIDVLVKLLESKDEKTRLTAATKLLDFQVQVADKISTDQMNRLIAQVKMRAMGGPQKLVPLEDGGDKPQKPLVDFGTVREIQ